MSSSLNSLPLASYFTGLSQRMQMNLNVKSHSTSCQDRFLMLVLSCGKYKLCKLTFLSRWEYKCAVFTSEFKKVVSVQSEKKV